MKKQLSKKINEITEVLGENQIVTYFDVPWSGEDLMLTGYGKMPGYHFEKGKMYALSVPKIQKISYKKQLKRAAKSKGITGITEVVRKEYVKRFGNNID
jgi:hypothetical protein